MHSARSASPSTTDEDENGSCPSNYTAAAPVKSTFVDQDACCFEDDHERSKTTAAVTDMASTMLSSGIAGRKRSRERSWSDGKEAVVYFSLSLFSYDSLWGGTAWVAGEIGSSQVMHSSTKMRKTDSGSLSPMTIIKRTATTSDDECVGADKPPTVATGKGFGLACPHSG